MSVAIWNENIEKFQYKPIAWKYNINQKKA